MDVKRLAVLRELAERGTVAAVAEEMNVTPSAVSQQLKLLEREAGVPLLEPSGRGVRLTAAGRRLAETATEVAVAIARAEAGWAEYLGSPAGDVTLGTFPSAGEMLLPGLLTRMAAEPAVNLVCRDADPTSRADVSELVPQHDIVLTDVPPLTETWQGRGLQVVPLMSEPLDVALPHDHPLARKATLTANDVAAERWIGAPHGFPFDRVLQALVGIIGAPLTVAQRLDDNGIVEALVAAGHGIAVLPRFTTRGHGSGVITRPLLGIRARRDISALLRPDRFERLSVRYVVQALRDEARAVADAHQSV